MAIMTDGFSTLVSIAGATLHEKTVTPPSIEGGGENDTTTMRNTAWRTRYPKLLKTLGEMTFTAAYDNAAYSTLVSAINVNQEVTITFPDGGTLVFWGWMDNVAPGDIAEGEQPEVTVTIIASNLDGSLAEIAPVLTPGT